MNRYDERAGNYGGRSRRGRTDDYNDDYRDRRTEGRRSYRDYDGRQETSEGDWQNRMGVRSSREYDRGLYYDDDRRESRSRYDEYDDDRDRGSRYDDYRNSRGRSSRYEEDDNDRRNENYGRGWFGDAQGHSEAAMEGWSHRGSRSGRRDRDDDNSYGRGGNRRGGDGRGWYGDSKGHSEAAERGWRNR